MPVAHCHTARALLVVVSIWISYRILDVKGGAHQNEHALLVLAVGTLLLLGGVGRGERLVYGSHGVWCIWGCVGGLLSEWPRCVVVPMHQHRARKVVQRTARRHGKFSGPRRARATNSSRGHGSSMLPCFPPMGQSVTSPGYVWRNAFIQSRSSRCRKQLLMVRVHGVAPHHFDSPPMQGWMYCR